jgi:hypothetical protein
MRRVANRKRECLTEAKYDARRARPAFFLSMLEVVAASGRAFPFFIVGFVLLLFVPLLFSAERLQEICRFLIAALGTFYDKLSALFFS